jgi:hypothetical protein
MRGDAFCAGILGTYSLHEQSSATQPRSSCIPSVCPHFRQVMVGASVGDLPSGSNLNFQAKHKDLAGARPSGVLCTASGGGWGPGPAGQASLSAYTIPSSRYTSERGVCALRLRQPREQDLCRAVEGHRCSHHIECLQPAASPQAVARHSAESPSSQPPNPNQHCACAL